jgi:hypothetical protein
VVISLSLKLRSPGNPAGLSFRLRTLTMARSIVLRFAAQCFDCGASLSAGSTARWFGKGRVSCCGNPTTKPGDYSPAAMPSDPPRADQRSDSMVTDGAVGRALQQGMQPHHLPIVAEQSPTMMLLVRLTSGARFLVTAEHSQHVIRCIEESLQDKVRDVMRAAGGAS